MYFEHMIKTGLILFHAQRNMRYLFVAPICNGNKLYNQGTNRAIARRSGVLATVWSAALARFGRDVWKVDTVLMKKMAIVEG